MIKRIIQQIIFIIVLAVILAALTWTFSAHIRTYGLSKVIVVCLITSATLVVLINRLLHYLGEIRYINSKISSIDKMSGEEFEYYLKLRFEKEGYKATLTKASQDYGADLILNKSNTITVVQAKRYDANVGTAAVQEVVAAKEYYHADYCMVVTNSHFTINALNLAEANDVILLDRDDLLKRTLC